MASTTYTNYSTVIDASWLNDVNTFTYGTTWNSTAGSYSTSGNLTFTGTGNRITGDFSNSTIANRTMFQDKTSGNNTLVSVIPNVATAGSSSITAYGHSDPSNSPYLTLTAQNNSGVTVVESGKQGTGTYLPITVYTGGLETARFNTNQTANIGGGSTANTGVFDVFGANGIAVRNATAAGAVATIKALGAGLGVAIDSTFSTGGYGPLKLRTSNLDSWVLDASGNVSQSTSVNGTLYANVSNQNAGASAVSVLQGSSNAGNVSLIKYSTAAGGHSVLGSTGGILYVGTSDANTLNITTGGVAKWTLDTSGNLISISGAVGYGTGSGTTGTQATSRLTSVALAAARNSGAITLVNAAPVVGTWVSFGVTNGGWAATDTIVVSVKSSSNTYVAAVTQVGAGTCNISIVSVAGTLADSPVINFSVLKGATA